VVWQLQLHGLMVAVAVSGGGGHVVSQWLHSMVVAGGRMARWWSWRSQWLHRGGMCGGGVHSDMAHVVTRAGQGGKCSGREGRDAWREAHAVGKGQGGHDGHRGRGKRE
jgi:hypothetical protein